MTPVAVIVSAGPRTPYASAGTADASIAARTATRTTNLFAITAFYTVRPPPLGNLSLTTVTGFDNRMVIKRGLF